jgi:hypothetical protein
VSRIPNAFKYRAGDAPVIDTGLFLHLYVPNLVATTLKPEDFHAPKLLVVRGSPGSGKSSLLRLLQVETLLALREAQPNEQAIIERLRELDVWDDDGPRAVGVYLQCDSNLRDLANVEAAGANTKLLNTLLDVRIVSTFLRALGQLPRFAAGSEYAADRLEGLRLKPLPPEDGPPPFFAGEWTVHELRAECERIEADFAALLSSFPGDPMPPSIRPHPRVFAIPFLAQQVRELAPLRGLVPIVMLDNLQDLYEQQREQVRDEFVRRAAIPRWVSVRKQVYELEELIPLSGSVEDRDYRFLDLDASPAGEFRRFAQQVADRRWRQSDGLRQYSTLTLRAVLPEDAEPAAERRRVEREIPKLAKKLAALDLHVDPAQLLAPAGGEAAADAPVPYERLLNFERQLILAERRKAKGQLVMFAIDQDEPSNSKTEEAAKLFVSRRYDLPYYQSFDALVEAANGNVEQFLSIAAAFTDKLIFRAELGRDLTLTPAEQDAMLRRSANEYHARIEQRYDMGFAIRTLVDNLGQFFEAVTHRPNAPYAPGVNGFGFTRDQLRQIVRGRSDPHVEELARVLTRAVAENVLFVRLTKQGTAGSQKVIFYLNRLLCVKFGLPLTTGGWQYVPVKTLVKMMVGPVPPKEWAKWKGEPSWFAEEAE